MAVQTISPVILCGGSGTRLWPLSRKTFPKQFSRLFDGETLFQRTVSRVTGDGFARPLLLTHQDFRFIVGEQISVIGCAAERIVVEPEGRNTAPAICLAALMLEERAPGALMLVLPSDHVIRDVGAFREAVWAGVGAAREGALVTFGIRPDRPETGYGYIELPGPARPDAHPKARPFARFIEKPDPARAEEMLASGRFLWNSGMFLFTAKAILAAFEARAPEILAAMRRAAATGGADLDFFRPGAEAYRAAPDISIDYAIMERVTGADSKRVVPVDCGWTDLGSWQTVWREETSDSAGTVAGPGATAIDCAGTLLRSDDPETRLVGIGLKDTIAVATRDAVLVAAMDRAQDVRKAVERLDAEGAAQATEFPRCFRPWGWYETLARGPRFQVKHIVVKPGGLLSLQSHARRSEHWVVVGGAAKATVDGAVREMTENESIYIPIGAVHRLENPGAADLHLIEVQSGAYLGEDDIIRYEDRYARPETETRRRRK